eukprot:1119666-Pelagomonas_calceolata.AAC.1
MMHFMGVDIQDMFLKALLTLQYYKLVSHQLMSLPSWGGTTSTVLQIIPTFIFVAHWEPYPQQHAGVEPSIMLLPPARKLFSSATPGTYKPLLSERLQQESACMRKTQRCWNYQHHMSS